MSFPDWNAAASVSVAEHTERGQYTDSRHRRRIVWFTCFGRQDVRTFLTEIVWHRFCLPESFEHHLCTKLQQRAAAMNPLHAEGETHPARVILLKSERCGSKAFLLRPPWKQEADSAVRARIQWLNLPTHGRHEPILPMGRGKFARPVSGVP